MGRVRPSDIKRLITSRPPSLSGCLRPRGRIKTIESRNASKAPLGNLMPYTPSPTRYDSMIYNRCGRSGLKLPAISLGLWHNFGFDKSMDSMRAICRTAFDLGITHFDLANNYAPPPGSAEVAFGDILRGDFRSLRDELVISPKAGHHM